MPHPSIVYFDLSDVRFAAELQELQQRDGYLAGLLETELMELNGKSWQHFAARTRWRFRENFFDGATTIGEGLFCGGDVVLTLLVNDTVVMPVSFRSPDMDRYLAGWR